MLCIERDENKRNPPPPPEHHHSQKWFIDDYLRIFQRVSAGESKKVIAAELGVSPERVRQLFKRAQRIEARIAARTASQSN